MSIRQALKKQIYKGIQHGEDVSILEEKLENMEYSTRQILDKKRGEYTRISSFLKIQAPIVEVRIKCLSRIREIDMEIQLLACSDNWLLPYSIKKTLNGLKTSAGNEIELRLSLLKPKKVKYIERSGRYVILELDGIKRRFNLWTKKEYGREYSY